MSIDMHSHWRPPALIELLRDRTEPPMVVTNDDGVDVLRTKFGDQPIAEAFDDVETRIAEMDELGISTAVLSLFGMYCWIERRPTEESVPLCRAHNDHVSEISKSYPGRFAAYASLPQWTLDDAVAELDRAMQLPGIIGAQIPGNAFLTLEEAESYRPLMEMANKHKAMMFIHWGPLAREDWPRTPKNADNFRRRMGTLDMQASLSANMVTMGMTDYLDDYPDVRIHIHNLGGNIPFEIERMDHRSLLDTPDEELPSKRFTNPNLFVDCNSFGPHSIEMGVRLYGAEKILFGTDGTAFGSDWSNKAIAEADIGQDARDAILYGNAARVLSDVVDLAPHQLAAAE